MSSCRPSASLGCQRCVHIRFHARARSTPRHYWPLQLTAWTGKASGKVLGLCKGQEGRGGPLVAACLRRQAECAGALQIIPMDERGQLAEAFNVRIDEVEVLDACLLAACDRPTLGLLWQDAKRARHFKTYEVSVRERVRGWARRACQPACTCTLRTAATSHAQCACGCLGRLLQRHSCCTCFPGSGVACEQARPARRPCRQRIADAQHAAWQRSAGCRRCPCQLDEGLCLVMTSVCAAQPWEAARQCAPQG